MKRMIVCAGLLCLMTTTAWTQATKPAKKISAQKKDPSFKEKKEVPVTNMSNNEYAAYTTPLSFNAGNFAGARIIPSPYSTINNAFVPGVSKREYGFANGRILLRNTGGTTSGSFTGSGGVGTGSSPAGIGTGSRTIGVNGKSFDAGNGMWGITVGTDPRSFTVDSASVRRKQ